jgi:hypothetical protein
MRLRAALALALLAGAASRGAADAAATFLTLDVAGPEQPGLVDEARPRRLVMLEDGTVYVGGTRDVAIGHVEKAELREIEKRLEKIRKQQPGLAGSLSFGPGSVEHRLAVAKGKPLELTTTGDPTGAPQSLRQLATLISDLASFQHPSLRPYRPSFYALRARPGTLAGGCRPWTFPVSIAQALAAPQPLSSQSAGDWPTGAVAASACAGDKTYVVTLRPLLPGEKP